MFARLVHRYLGDVRNAGIPYLIVILLATALVAGAFRKDGGVLLIPILLIGASIVAVLWLKKLKSSHR